MTQIFILGSSSVYGVGAEDGGWADLIKLALHKKMYRDGGIGQKLEIYNFGKTGETIEFVSETFPQQLEKYGRGGKIITIVSVGGNNAKADDFPENFVSTVAEYTTAMTSLLDLLKKLSTNVVAVGGGYFDESKTNPIPNLTGGISFFNNARKQQLEAVQQQLCSERQIPFVGVQVTEEEWLQNYLYRDGLHPNQKGCQLISQNVLAELEKII